VNWNRINPKGEAVYDQFLHQAKRLAGLDSKKPKQGNLRRADSSAYYALFHFLVDQACRLVVGSQHKQAPFRQVLGRAFEHGTMKSACVSFAGGTLKVTVAKGLPPTFSIPVEIKLLAGFFVDLQLQRHFADYDLTERFHRSAVLGLIKQTETCITQFKNLAATDEKAFFLACLWAWKALANR
jgi:hypothetical protein